MESVQRELMSVLLGKIQSLGLISKTTYLNAEDGLYSGKGLPELLGPVRQEKEAGGDGYTQGAR